jgi:antitoxin PrlF
MQGAVLVWLFLGNAMPMKVTAKGQVTIPKRIRDMLGIQPGSKIDKQSASGRQYNRFAVLRGSSSSGMSTDEIMSLMRGEN